MDTIIRTSDQPENYFEEDCFIAELLNKETTPGLSISQCRVKPGVTTVLHRLKGVEEKYYILSGIGEMELGGILVGKVSKGDLVLIDANTSQRITNAGEEDLLFLCICTPRFRVESYEGL